MKKVTIVTVNYNTEDDTRKLLTSIEKSDASDIILSVIIVDNGSNTPFQLDANNSCKIIRINENTGFTGGYNRGIKEALEMSCDYVLIINNDTIIAPDLIQNLMKGFENNDTIGVTVPKIYFAKGHEFHKATYTKEELGKVLWYAGGKIDWNNVVSIHRGVDEVDHGQYEKDEQIEFASGCCLMIKSEVLKETGYFDDRYFLYYEDADLGERIKRAGYTICYVPEAAMYHVNASSSGGAGNVLQDYFLTRNQMLFGMTYAPLKSKAALLRQSLRFLLTGRPYQKKAIKDYYLRKYGKGTFFDRNKTEDL